ncbi:MAG: DUF4846 domain-containing protein [Polyangiaceae bacterium]|nr:DUF4846 domain-containing protein [Polyangiaceae bacterium]
MVASRLARRSLLGCFLLASACAAQEPASSAVESELVPSIAVSNAGPGVEQSIPASLEKRAPGASAPTSALHAPTAEELARYPWLTEGTEVRALEDSIAPPKGYRRVSVEDGSFGAFLRRLPLRPEGTPVRAYDGRLLRNAESSGVTAVAELDVSNTDIQQCADSVIRLHAEWKWSKGEQASVGYHFLSGDFATWPKFAAGQRPVAEGKGVRWTQSGKAGSDHATYRKYLDMVFNYASTISLDKKSSSPIDHADIAPGDFFVLPGGPGHAILILDVVTDEHGHRSALLGQGFMPAQDFHVLHPLGGEQGPWFSLDGDAVDTPFWPEPFPWSSLRRMK